MLEGHDWTATDKGPLEDIMVSQRFTTLLQGHRESIRHLQLIHYNFGSLDNLARLIASLPSLTTLYLEGCSLGYTSTEQVSGHDHSKLPAIPLSLRSLGVKVEAIYKPHLVFDTLALATWFSMTSTDRHSYEVDLNMPFPLMSNQFEYRQVIAQILSEFGSNLTKVNFEITQYLISCKLTQYLHSNFHCCILHITEAETFLSYPSKPIRIPMSVPRLLQESQSSSTQPQCVE